MIDITRILFELTQKLLSASDQKDWDSVEAIQAQRLALLKQMEAYNPETLPEPVASEVAQMLSEIREIEKHCRALATAQRDELTQAHGKVSKGKAMQRAYGQGR